MKKLIDKEQAIFEKNKYYDIYNIQNIDGELYNKNLSPGYPNFVCKNCEIIDDLCNQYYKSNDDVNKTNIINKLEKFLMNGYDLTEFYGSNGCDIMLVNNVDKIQEAGTYIVENNTEDDMENLHKYNTNLVNVNLRTARWCKFCGARKPDIIDE